MFIIERINRLYNPKLEDICTRILYFFNTINTYFIVAGTASFLLVYRGIYDPVALILSFLFAVVTGKTSDFFPVFPLLAVPTIIGLVVVLGVDVYLLMTLLIANIVIFFVVQFVFMGIPDSIVARDVRVPFIKMVHSLLTIAPTTVSFSMSVFFSFYLSFCLVAGASCHGISDGAWLGGGGLLFLLETLVARAMRPKNLFSKMHKPDVRDKPLFKRVVILNIDGVRKDVFDALNLPAIGRIAQNGSSHVTGLETVYRALTNPAFASIFTGTIPKYHGVHDNNFGQSIKTEGLPDIVPTIAYGSMHVRHFCKKSWETRIVSLPRHSIYRCDGIMVDWLKHDLCDRPEIRLFVADFSEADFLAHAYGSTSSQYKDAIGRVDVRIGDLMDWMETNGMSEGTAVIICSDHGIAAIDHSYLIADSERYVPFLMHGKGIKKGFRMREPGKIMDICCTTAYLLGTRYPSNSRGRVFTEALDGCDQDVETEQLVSRFNRLKYDAEASRYQKAHVEVYEGDALWWEQCISKYTDKKKVQAPRVLDIGCGNGFVGERFIAMGMTFSEFVCVDISETILNEARKKLGDHRNFTFSTDLASLRGAFDLIAASSVFHHVVHPEKLARAIDGLLAETGIVIGSHEPNRNAFKNRLFRAAAHLYKNIGGGVSIDKKMVGEFNRLLRGQYPQAPPVCREEILQMVEYHSPLEQSDRSIDVNAGFEPHSFSALCFPGYEVLELETYSTCFHRPWLSKHRKLQRLLMVLFNVMFQEGNLFRFVLKKTKS